MAFEEGIYFNLPYEEYRAVPALSCSGMKDLLISPLYYWEKHINPDREPEETTDAKEYGSACHKYVLEPESFFEHYVFIPEDAPNRPSSRQINAKKPSPESVAAINWWNQFNATNAGKKIAKQKWLNDFSRARSMLENYAEIKDAFSSGYAEVSIFIKQDGVMYKCRADYLKPDEILDLKTFSNSKRKPVDKAIGDAIIYEKYNLQYFMYSGLVEQAKKLLKGKKIKSYGEVSENFITSFSESRTTKFSFVFQESGAPYEARKIELVKAFSEGATSNVYHVEGSKMFDKALTRYKENIKAFGNRPWIGDMTSYTLSDEEIPNIVYQSY